MDRITPPSRLFTFAGGSTGEWVVLQSKSVIGAPLPPVSRISITNGPPTDQAEWMLQGTTSNERYVERKEKTTLAGKQEPLGRTEAQYGAIIPIRKNELWWSLPQNERRAIFETSSRHIETGLRYLPAISRRLHHCRDLSEAQPFDFITLFDYAPGDATAFEELVAALRETEEWKYVDREFDIRMCRA